MMMMMKIQEGDDDHGEAVQLLVSIFNLAFSLYANFILDKPKQPTRNKRHRVRHRPLADDKQLDWMQQSSQHENKTQQVNNTYKQSYAASKSTS